MNIYWRYPWSQLKQINSRIWRGRERNWAGVWEENLIHIVTSSNPRARWSVFPISYFSMWEIADIAFDKTEYKLKRSRGWPIRKRKRHSNFSKYGPNPATFCLLLSFSRYNDNVAQLTINGKRVDGMLGIRIWDPRMEDADKSTELWLPHELFELFWVEDNFVRRSWRQHHHHI